MRRFRSAGARVGSVALALGLVLTGFAGVSAAVSSHARPSLSPTNDYVNITATESLSFNMTTFTVYPGATVHIQVTQGANFAHTFTLSSVRNATIPTTDSMSQLYAYFNAHPPIVNFSLGSTEGTVNSTTFTAPAVGTYEYVCEIHFPGMRGTMVSSTSPPSSGSSPVPFPITYLALILLGVVVVVVAAVLLVRRRRPKSGRDADPFADGSQAPAGGTPPGSGSSRGR